MNPKSKYFFAEEKNKPVKGYEIDFGIGPKRNNEY